MALWDSGKGAPGILGLNFSFNIDDQGNYQDSDAFYSMELQKLAMFMSFRMLRKQVGIFKS